MGEWLAVHGEAIYGTRSVAPFIDGKWRFTRQKDNAVYAIYLLNECERHLPETLVVPKFNAAPGSEVRLVGAVGSALNWTNSGGNLKVNIPGELNAKLPSDFAVALRIEEIKETNQEHPDE
jgi:alpha-L-fucosidase